ncbi:MAG: hypothetical protein JO102_00355, partial [Elusimicrobia bacterium]|nr:hypothetical protein [Elusimicrobiota bacterium]
MIRPPLSIIVSLGLLAAPAGAQLPGESAPVAQAAAPVAAPRRVRRRHSSRKVSQYTLDKKAVFAPALTAAGGLKTPARSSEAQGCSVVFKAVSPGTYFAAGLISDFSEAAQAAIRARLNGIAGAGRASGRIAKGLAALMDAGTPERGYVEALIAVDPASREINVASVKKMRNLSRSGGAPAAAAAPAVPEPASTEEEPAISSEAPELPGNARMGPTWAALPGEAPGVHSVPEPLAIGREAVNMPTLTAEQRIGVRDFAAGPLTVFVKA